MKKLVGENRRNKTENDELLKVRRKEIRENAELLLRGTALIHPDLSKEIIVRKKSIKEWLNQPHEHFNEKNELLPGIAGILRTSEYKGWSLYHKNNPMYVKSHVFETEIEGDKSWIIVLEDVEGVMILYSISDNSKVLEGLKK